VESVSPGFQGRTSFSVFNIVEPLFFDLLRLGFPCPSPKSGTAAIAIQIQSSLARAVDMTCPLVIRLTAICAFVFHALLDQVSWDDSVIGALMRL
jgi:hypothetical protein